MNVRKRFARHVLHHSYEHYLLISSKSAHLHVRIKNNLVELFMNIHFGCTKRIQKTFTHMDIDDTINVLRHMCV